MKNKKLIYILVPAVIFIWGTIIYRIVGMVKPSEVASLSTSSPIEFVSSVRKDTFSLLRGYRDPFEVEDNLPVKRSLLAQKANEPTKKKSAVTGPVSVEWPQIVYSGIIKNQQSKKELAMVQFNGQNALMRAGEKWNDIELLRVFKDSIEVRNCKNKKWVKK